MCNQEHERQCHLLSSRSKWLYKEPHQINARPSPNNGSEMSSISLLTLPTMAMTFFRHSSTTSWLSDHNANLHHNWCPPLLKKTPIDCLSSLSNNNNNGEWRQLLAWMRLGMNTLHLVFGIGDFFRNVLRDSGKVVFKEDLKATQRLDSLGR